MKKSLWIVVGFAVLVSPMLTADEAAAEQRVKAAKKCGAWGD